MFRKAKFDYRKNKGKIKVLKFILGNITVV